MRSTLPSASHSRSPAILSRQPMSCPESNPRGPFLWTTRRTARSPMAKSPRMPCPSRPLCSASGWTPSRSSSSRQPHRARRVPRSRPWC
ncbi:hypothetical protein VTK26DRAFT_3697 [Humicola hyalothermophila]